MRSCITIPTGNRPDRAIDVAKMWMGEVSDVVAYCWDDETAERMKACSHHILTGERKSFAILTNLLAKQTEWDWLICGADDLYPVETYMIDTYAKKYNGKILWAMDGLFNKRPTHPIITRGWYDKYGQIFDERFEHNFCDTDLFTWASQKGEVVKCFEIEFDHTHPLKTGKEPDEIYKIGMESYERDKKRFYDKYKDSSTMLGFVPIGV